MEERPPSRPVLLFLWQQNWATRQTHPHYPTHITHQNVLMRPISSCASLSVNSHMWSSPSRTRSSSWIWVILALPSVLCPSRAVLDHHSSYHYSDVIMDEIASQNTSLTIVYSTVYSDADQRKHQSSASLAFMRGIHRWPVNSPHKWSVTRKMFPFDDVTPWWRHQMEKFSALLAICAGNSPVPGEFPTQRPVTRSFDVFFDLRLNKRLSKQWWGWWFETPSCPLRRHRNAMSFFRGHRWYCSQTCKLCIAHLD